MRRTLNVKLLAGLLTATAVLGGSVHLVHGFQEGRNAGSLLKRADKEEQKENLAEVEKYLSRYLVYRPDDANAIARYGLLLDKLGTSARNPVRVLTVLEQAIRRAPDPNDDLCRAARRKAVDLEMMPGLGRYKEARANLEVLLKATPDDGELEALKGQSYEAEGKAGQIADALDRYSKAKACYEKAVAHAPDRIDPYVRLAGLLRDQLHDPTAADRLIDQMVAGSPKLPRSPRSQAQAHLARARYRQRNGLPGAEEDISRASELAPDDPDVLLAAAESAQGRDDEGGARKLIGRGLERHPGDVRMYQALAALEARAGRGGEALAVLRRGLEALPDKHDLRWLLAELLIQTGDLEGARAEIARLRGKDNVFQPVVDHLEARLLLKEVGRRPEAVQRLEKARALMATVPGLADLTKQADLLLAESYERLGNPERQLAACRRALALDPRSVPARLGQAVALLTLGRANEALEAYRAVAPQWPEARGAVARLMLARNLRLPEGQRRWPEVDQALDEAERAMPGAAEVTTLRADALAARGQLDRAGDLLRQARDRQPERVELWVALANLAVLRGEPAAVPRLLDEARQRVGDRAELRLAAARYWGQRGGDGAREALEGLARGLDKLPAANRLRVEEGLAEAYARLGDVPRAETLWTRVAAGRPDDPRPAARLLDLALQAGDRADEAAVRTAVERLRRIEGEDGAQWRVGEVARRLLLPRQGDARQFDEARLILAEVDKRRPEWVRVPLLEAEIAEQQGDTGRAIDGYLRAVDRGERRPAVVRRLVELLNARRRFTDAERVVRKLSEDAPLSGTLAQLTAEMALRHNDTQGALEQARRAVPAGSNDPRDQLWLGQVSWAAGRQAEAGDAFRRAVTLAPEAPEAWLIYLDYLSRTAPEDRPAALKQVTVEEAAREARKALPPDRAAPVLAFGYTATGHADQAERQLLDALAASPDDPALLLGVADYYFRTGQAAKAEPHLRKVIEDRSGATPGQRAVARRRLALVLVTQGGLLRVQEALALLESNLQARRESPEDQRLKALVLGMRPGGQRDAIRAFEELARIQPPTHEEKAFLAGLYEASGDWPRARSLLLDALAEGGDNPAYLDALARGLLAHGQARDAAPWVDRLVKLRPQDPEAVALQARLLAAQNQGSEAVALVRAYTRDKDDFLGPFAALLEELGQADAAEAMFRDSATRSGRPEATLALAGFLGRRGRPSEALDVCDRAWQTCDPRKVGLTSVKILYAAGGDDALFRRVTDRLEEAVRKQPEVLSLQFDLANLYSRQGRYREAEALLRRVQERDQGSEGPLNNLAWVLAAEGKGEEALPLINRAIALVGPEPGLLDTRALAYIATGQRDLAVKDLQEAIAASPSADKYLHLAQALMPQDRKAASAAFRKAEALGLDATKLAQFEREAYARLSAQIAPK
jgi:tetratricopeptide (TPR) repeat protein